MSAEIGPESVDAQDDECIQELRALFARNNVSFGRPDDLIAAAARMSEETPLRGEVISRLCAIVQGRGERFSRGQLMRFVVLAAGGPTVSPDMPELQTALWQIAHVVNAAFAQGAGARLRAPGDGLASAEDSVPPAILPLNEEQISVLPDDCTAKPGPTMQVQATPRALRPGLRLLRRIGRAVQQGTVRGAGATRRFRFGAKENGWVFPAVVFFAAAGVLVYLLWPSVPRRVVAGADGAATRTAPLAATSAMRTATVVTGPQMCVGPTRAGVSREGIDERSSWAHKLLAQKLYPVALSQLRGLEAVNPGYPGVALDESEALFGMEQMGGARAAIEAQVRISGCLASLPTAGVDAYCREEFSSGDKVSCRATMARIQAAAELQAARVHLELANRLQPEERSEAALAALTKDEPETARFGTRGELAGDAGNPDGEEALPIETRSTADAEEVSVPSRHARRHRRRRG